MRLFYCILLVLLLLLCSNHCCFAALRRLQPNNNFEGFPFDAPFNVFEADWDNWTAGWFGNNDNSDWASWWGDSDSNWTNSWSGGDTDWDEWANNWTFWFNDEWSSDFPGLDVTIPDISNEAMCQFAQIPDLPESVLPLIPACSDSIASQRDINCSSVGSSLSCLEGFCEEDSSWHCGFVSSVVSANNATAGSDELIQQVCLTIAEGQGGANGACILNTIRDGIRSCEVQIGSQKCSSCTVCDTASRSSGDDNTGVTLDCDNVFANASTDDCSTPAEVFESLQLVKPGNGSNSGGLFWDEWGTTNWTGWFFDGDYNFADYWANWGPTNWTSFWTDSQDDWEQWAYNWTFWLDESDFPGWDVTIPDISNEAFCKFAEIPNLPESFSSFLPSYCSDDDSTTTTRPQMQANCSSADEDLRLACLQRFCDSDRGNCGVVSSVVSADAAAADGGGGSELIQQVCLTLTEGESKSNGACILNTIRDGTASSCEMQIGSQKCSACDVCSTTSSDGEDRATGVTVDCDNVFSRATTDACSTPAERFVSLQAVVAVADSAPTPAPTAISPSSAAESSCYVSLASYVFAIAVGAFVVLA